VAQRVRPWSMIKLRFRRFEAPELLRRAAPIDKPSTGSLPTDGPHADQWIEDIGVGGANQEEEQPKLAHVALLSRAVEQVTQIAASRRKNPSEVGPFDAVYDGIVLDASDLPVTHDSRSGITRELHAPVRFITLPEKKTDLGPDRQYTRVVATLTPEKKDGELTGQLTLKIEGSTALGFAGAWSISLRSDVLVSVRVVVSQRPKPEDDKPYMPSGDLSVRVRLGRGDSIDVLRGEAENSWLMVFCLPVNAEGTLKPDQEVRVSFEGTAPTRKQQAQALYSTLRPIRLSDLRTKMSSANGESDRILCVRRGSPVASCSMESARRRYA